MAFEASQRGEGSRLLYAQRSFSAARLGNMEGEGWKGAWDPRYAGRPMAIGKDAWGTPFVAKGKDDRWMAKGKGAWSSPFDDWKGDAGMKKGDAGWLGAREGWNDKSREHVAYKGKGRRDSWNSFEKQDLRMNPDPRANRDPRTNPEVPPWVPDKRCQ